MIDDCFEWSVEMVISVTFRAVGIWYHADGEVCNNMSVSLGSWKCDMTLFSSQKVN